MTYSEEQFGLAVHLLKTSKKPLSDRIAEAYMHNIMYVKGELLSEEIKPMFDSLCKKLTSETPVGDEGSCLASVRKMSNEELESIYDEIKFIDQAIRLSM